MITLAAARRCKKARVGADYFCPADARRRLHRCTYTGAGDRDRDCLPARVRHANSPAEGMCFKHTFAKQECTNGLPPRGAKCLVAIKEAAQCGQEQDFKAIGPGEEDDMHAGIRWWNGQPCGNARVTVDYYCPPLLD